MGNINTYLKWRGDLSFAERPFCEADNLALALLSYLDFDDIVPDSGEKICLAAAYEKFILLQRGSAYLNGACTQLFQLMAESNRFRAVQLSHYRVVYDEQQATQFAAIQIALGDGSVYVSFRGTDDTIIGWQEDFSIGSQVVPAQRSAADYFNEIATKNVDYRIGGHSKGGNLAIYAAIHCPEELSEKIIAVYNNDGPGLSRDIVNRERYLPIRDKLIWIIPGFSVIGTLFPYEKPTRIVESNGDGLIQHDAFTWQIEGDCFEQREELTDSCKFYVQIFDTWISSADFKQRETFTADFFGALRAGGAKTMGEVRSGGLDGFGTILLSIVRSESRTKIVIGKFVASFLKNCRSINLRESLKSKQMLSGGLLLLAGLLLMLFPHAALRLTGTLAGMAGIFFSGKKLFACALNPDMEVRQKKMRMLSWLGAICTVEFLIVNRSVVLTSSRVVLGIALLVFAFRSVYQMAKRSCSLPEQAWTILVAVAALLLGLVSLTSDGTDSAAIFTLGTFSVGYSVVSMMRTLYQNGKSRGAQAEHWK